MPNNFNLNQDCVITGLIVSSEVTQSRLATDDVGRKPVYSVEIKPEPGVTDSLALLYGMATGMNCLNAVELHRQFESSRTLVFESLNKPFVSGVDETTGEYTPGTEVKVSARLEYKETLSKTEDGFFATPRLILRFVDLIDAVEPSEPLPEVDWDSVRANYDF